MKKQAKGLWVRLLCWILAGLMILGAITTTIFAIFGIF